MNPATIFTYIERIYNIRNFLDEKGSRSIIGHVLNCIGAKENAEDMQEMSQGGLANSIYGEKAFGELTTKYDEVFSKALEPMTSENYNQFDESWIKTWINSIVDHVNTEFGTSLVSSNIVVAITDPSITSEGSYNISFTISGDDVEGKDFAYGKELPNTSVQQKYLDDKTSYLQNNLDISGCTTQDQVMQKINENFAADNIVHGVSSFQYDPPTVFDDGSIQITVSVQLTDESGSAIPGMSSSADFSTTIAASPSTVANDIVNNVSSSTGDRWEFYQTRNRLEYDLTLAMSTYVSNNFADQGLITEGSSNKNCELIIDTYNLQESTMSYSFHVKLTSPSGVTFNSSVITRNYTYDPQQLADNIYIDVQMKFSMSAVIWNTDPANIKYLVDDNILTDVNYDLTSGYGTTILRADSGTVTVSGSTANVPINIHIGSRSFPYTYKLNVG